MRDLKRMGAGSAIGARAIALGPRRMIGLSHRHPVIFIWHSFSMTNFVAEQGVNGAFQAVHNFRDFGGYPVEGGRVRTGQLFRSAHYAHASDDDLELFVQLGMAAIVDLRRPGERFRLPSRRGEACRAVMVAYGEPSEDTMAPHLSFLRDAEATEELVENGMIGIYRAFAFEPGHIQVFGDAFRALATLDGPVVVHCHAGKDRTGLLCALIHHVLGVSEDDMFTDYLRTNDASRIEKRLPEMRQLFIEASGREAPDALLRKC